MSSAAAATGLPIARGGLTRVCGKLTTKQQLGNDKKKTGEEKKTGNLKHKGKGGFPKNSLTKKK